MQNKTNSNIKALEVLINDNDEATAIASYLETILMGYIPTDEFCQSMVKERHNLIFAAQSTINFFRYLEPISSKEAFNSLNRFLESIEPAQAVAVWSEATFTYVATDGFCERNEMDRECLIYTVRSVINYFSAIQQN